MALSFGWKANDLRETIWKDDPALKDVPQSALDDWEKDGDASHLRNYALAGKPTVFTFRPLKFSEAQYVNGIPDGTLGSFFMAIAACFRIAVRFPDAPTSYEVQSSGQKNLNPIERVQGIPMLSEGFCSWLSFQYPEMIRFYGALIFAASRPSEPEKKASSPPPIMTPSSATEGTAETPAAGAAAA